MLLKLAKRIFGTTNDRIIKSLTPIVNKINSLEKDLEKLTDQELANKTHEFKSRLGKNEELEDILPEAFAVVREASKRVLNMRHFDVQLIGGIVLHRGMISEMKTGEGKTLVATLPLYLNALSGKGVHLVTANDYLAERDSQWMGKIFQFLGLSVGCITNSTTDIERKSAYAADITYGTNNEFGFDYLRDNLKHDIESMVQRPFNFAIVDEVDSILIDESRTPLIISGPAEDNSELYNKINKLIPLLTDEDYEIDEKAKTCVLTDKGHDSVESLLLDNGIIKSGSSLYDIENISIVHHVNQALKAHKMFHRDVDYIVKDNKIMIIDEFTGRVLDGRRYSEGLHQALEAKERVKIQNENQTLASITFQNYFRMYPKLAGMTGTALTEAAEFYDIYKLGVISIPTNIPVARKDEEDVIYCTAKEKYNAIVEEIERVSKKGQPILVGTISIEKSEHISSLLKKKKIKHNVLNAKYHAKEAEIIAQAGRPGSVTIATNMAGRGTDIMLGGNPEMLIEAYLKENPKKQRSDVESEIYASAARDRQKIIEAGGLFVLGTERHESRRIDDQLRGRAGRQGDPGTTRFYISLEDDLMRIFGSERIGGILMKMGLKEGEAIIHPWISRSIEKAQQRVESRNYDIRKNLLRFDDVMNDQRKVVYKERMDIMSSSSLIEQVKSMIEEININLVRALIPARSLPEEWDVEAIDSEVFRIYGIHADVKGFAGKEGVADKEILEFINTISLGAINKKAEVYGLNHMEEALKHIMLITLDHMWKEHLHMLDHLRTGINLRAYAQKDPLNEYKIEAFQMFKRMLEEYSSLIVQRASQIHIQASQSSEEEGGSDLKPDGERVPKVSRNDPCPCGSGKKYKFCHGAL